MSERDDSIENDEEVAALLRQVGARREPPADLVQQVRQAVHAEWREAVDERARRRRSFAYGLAASIAVLVMVSSIALRWTISQPSVVGTIALIEGRLRSDAGGDSPGVRVGETVHAGDALRTDAGSRAALEIGQGMSVRIDRDSLVEFVAPDRLVLRSGAVYVDARPGKVVPDDFVIQTRAGDVRHLGTQYQVRDAAHLVEISVREGRVAAVLKGGGDAVASAGEQLRIAASGSIDRARIARNDPLWSWVAQAAPPFDIEDQSLAQFLEWVARETGASVQYATVEARAAAEALTLRGSIEGLDPSTALKAVLSTTQFVHQQADEGVILVALARER